VGTGVEDYDDDLVSMGTDIWPQVAPILAEV